MATLAEALDEVCARFLAELPEDEARDATRLGFHLEQAHWYYVDFLQPESPDTLPALSFRAFGCALAEHAAKAPAIPAAVRSILAGKNRVASIIDAFTVYKRRVPTCGAIVLDRRMESVLVVCGAGSRTWTFPKGKIARDEDPADCARREVMEETGFDIARFLRRDAFIQISTGTHGGGSGGEKRAVRLYIVPTDLDVSSSSAGVFLPQARNEIDDIQWHPVRDLAGSGGRAGTRYYHVQPFMARLVAWIAAERGQASATPDGRPAPTATRKKARKGRSAATDDPRIVKEILRDAVETLRGISKSPAGAPETVGALETSSGARKPFAGSRETSSGTRTTLNGSHEASGGARMAPNGAIKTAVHTAGGGPCVYDSAIERPMETLQRALRRHMAALEEPPLDTARLFALYTSASRRP